MPDASLERFWGDFEMVKTKGWVFMSVLGEDMVKDGYLNVISVDNSASCFEQLNARYKGKKEYAGLTCECASISFVFVS